jgi:hypothetical protein
LMRGNFMRRIADLYASFILIQHSAVLSRRSRLSS